MGQRGRLTSARVERSRRRPLDWLHCRRNDGDDHAVAWALPRRRAALCLVGAGVSINVGGEPASSSWPDSDYLH